MEMTGLWTKIVESPVGQKVLADEAAALVKRRQGLAAERRAACAELEKATAAVAKVQTAEAGKVEAARLIWAEVTRQANLVAAEGRSSLFALQRRIDAAEGALLGSADVGRIAATRDLLRTLETQTRNAPSVATLQFGYRMTSQITATDYDARVVALQAIRAIVRGLDGLALEPLSTSELEARLSQAVAEAKAAMAVWRGAEVPA